MRKTMRASAALLAAGAATSIGAAGAADHGAQGFAVALGLVSAVSTALGVVAALISWAGGSVKQDTDDKV